MKHTNKIREKTLFLLYMFIAIIKSAFRNIKKRKFNTFLSVLGLSIGFTSFILISLFIKYELSWDSYHTNYNKIYRVQTYKTIDNEKLMQTSPALFDFLEDRYNNIENHCIVFPNAKEFLSVSDLNIDVEVEGIYADQNYLDMFTLDFLYGSFEKPLSEPSSIVISSSLAKTLFEDLNPVGETILLQKKHNLLITGVYNDMPINSHLRPEFIVSFQSLEVIWNRSDLFDDWDWNSFYNYVLINEDTDVKTLNVNLKNILKDKILTDYRQLYLRPLSKLYMYSTNNNYMMVVVLLSVFSIFVLVLASINYMNLALASSTSRYKEIGVKKVIGANRSSLVFQVFLETFLVTLFSLILSFIFVELSINIFNQSIDTSLSFSMLFKNGLFLFLIGIILVVSVLSSIYPAWLITSFNSIDLFNKKISQGKKNKLSLKKILIGFQFFISILLITLTVLMTKQINYTKTMDVGFTKSDLLFVEIFPTEKDVKFNQIKNRFISDPNIQSISVSQGFPIQASKYIDIKMINWEGGAREQMTEVYSFWTSSNFINTLDLEIIEGRGFSDNYTGDKANVCIINETAVKQFGWSNPIGKHLDNRQLEVIGVLKDFHFHDMYNSIKPIIITPKDNNIVINSPAFFSFRYTSGFEKQVRDKVEYTIKEFYPKDPFEAKVFIDHFKTDDIFKVYDTINSIFFFFALIAVALSVLGVFGLVTHTLNQRTKEIAIRKISGCSSFSILKSITFEYIFMILVASVFGLTGAYYIDNSLPIYYPVEKSILDFLFAVLLAITITLITIGFKTWKESTRNPVEALKYE